MNRRNLRRGYWLLAGGAFLNGICTIISYAVGENFVYGCGVGCFTTIVLLLSYFLIIYGNIVIFKHRDGLPARMRKCAYLSLGGSIGFGFILIMVNILSYSLTMTAFTKLMEGGGENFNEILDQMLSGLVIVGFFNIPLIISLALAEGGPNLRSDNLGSRILAMTVCVAIISLAIVNFGFVSSTVDRLREKYHDEDFLDEEVQKSFTNDTDMEHSTTIMIITGVCHILLSISSFLTGVWRDEEGDDDYPDVGGQ